MGKKEKHWELDPKAFSKSIRALLFSILVVFALIVYMQALDDIENGIVFSPGFFQRMLIRIDSIGLCYSTLIAFLYDLVTSPQYLQRSLLRWVVVPLAVVFFAANTLVFCIVYEMSLFQPEIYNQSESWLSGTLISLYSGSFFLILYGYWLRSYKLKGDEDGDELQGNS